MAQLLEGLVCVSNSTQLDYSPVFSTLLRVIIRTTWFEQDKNLFSHIQMVYQCRNKRRINIKKKVDERGGMVEMELLILPFVLKDST